MTRGCELHFYVNALKKYVIKYAEIIVCLPRVDKIIYGVNCSFLTCEPERLKTNNIIYKFKKTFACLNNLRKYINKIKKRK